MLYMCVVCGILYICAIVITTTSRGPGGPMVNNKKSNRTKGNVQPSSSARAAQLLSNKQHCTGTGSTYIM